jgi:hypothetical protein
VVRAQLAAIAADLRYLQGYCNKISSLDFRTTLEPEVQTLARYAMGLGLKLHDLRNEIRELLFPPPPPTGQPEHSATPQEPGPEVPQLTLDRLITG